jgi:hypothetical protein
MPKNRQRPAKAKEVVYLWGAGATQAEIDYVGARKVNLLMRDSEQLGDGVATRILQQIPKRWRSSFQVDQGMDIEKLISLLEASTVAEYAHLAERIRQLYFEDIRTNLASAKVLLNPQLATSLLTMHRNSQFRTKETLSGIITTNHDGLTQLAMQKVLKAVNLGIPFQSKDLILDTTDAAPILQLHGSFTWIFGVPLRVSLLSETSTYARNTVWIPPTILKESKSYPFNKLSGLAYELLSKKCDVLRVVGSALTQNDWNVVSMIFNAQRHRALTKGAPFRVELIMPHKHGVGISKDCSYLTELTPIGFLTEGDFAVYKDEGTHEARTSEMENPFFYWLKEKIQFHRDRGDFGGQPLEPALRQITGES